MQSPSKSQRQNEQRDVSCHAQCRQDRDDIPTRFEPLPMKTVLADFSEELLVALPPSEQTRKQNSCPVHSEESPNAIELSRKNLEHHECE